MPLLPARHRDAGVVAAALIASAALAAARAQSLADLVGEARVVREIAAIENDYVRVRYRMLEYPRANRVEPERPVLLYIHLSPGPGILHTRLLPPPPAARPPGPTTAAPRAVSIAVLGPPPPRPDLGTLGTAPPRGTIEENRWDGGRLLLATFRPFDYAVGAGPYASVTIFLSDGVVEVSSRGLRRQMAVQAGDAFWFEPATRITVLDDYPVGAAIVQLIAGR